MVGLADLKFKIIENPVKYRRRACGPDNAKRKLAGKTGKKSKSLPPENQLFYHVLNYHLPGGE